MFNIPRFSHSANNNGIKAAEGSFTSPNWLFGQLLLSTHQVIGLFPSFGRKKFQHNASLRSLGLINVILVCSWTRSQGTKEKRV